MPRRRGHSKSASIASMSDAQNSTPMPPPSPPQKAATPAKKVPRQALSKTSPPASPGAPIAALANSSQRKSQISQIWRFPVVVILTFALSSLLFSLIATVQSGDLASISKHTESVAEIAMLLGWKATELGIYWFSGYDALDVSALTLLLSTPQTVLLSLFYNISPTTLALTTVASVISATVPFTLLRSLSPSHAPNSTNSRGLVRNKPILTDTYTMFSTSVLATAIFAVLLEASFATYLPSFLIVHFDHLRDLSAAHLGASGLPALLISLAPAGIACTVFLFLPSTGVVNAHLQAKSFEPATATFGEHVYHNAWGWYSARQRELIKRTFVAAVMLATESVVQIFGTIKGVELEGAAGYAGFWAAGVVLVGLVYEWVGGPSG